MELLGYLRLQVDRADKALASTLEARAERFPNEKKEALREHRAALRWQSRVQALEDLLNGRE